MAILHPTPGTRRAELPEKVERANQQRSLPPAGASSRSDGIANGGDLPARRALVRDFLIFLVKLWLDGIKDLVLLPVSFVAAGIDFGLRTRLFYRVLRLGERFDLWLNLFGAAQTADREREGLFGASRAGDPTLLGQLERFTTGEEEDAVRRPTR